MNYLTNSSVFHPPRPLVVFPPAELDPVCDELWREHRVASSVLHHPAPRCVALYCHGNAENIHLCADFAAALSREACATVYSIEYPGYFRDEHGVAPSSERALNAAAAAAASRLARQPLPLLLVGYSLGSAPTVHAAGTDAVRGCNAMLVLMAPLVGALRTQLAGGGLLAALVSPIDVFRTDVIAATLALKAAVVFHGTEDKVIPTWHGQRVADALKAHTPQVKFWALPGVNHDTVRAEALPIMGRSVSTWLDAE